jgi:hypothetical protein
MADTPAVHRLERSLAFAGADPVPLTDAELELVGGGIYDIWPIAGLLGMGAAAFGVGYVIGDAVGDVLLAHPTILNHF